MKPGDLVRVKTGLRWHDPHADLEGRIAVVLAEATRRHVPAVKVMVLGEVIEFDIDELEWVAS